LKYRYEDLYPAQFEELVVCLCQEILGVGVQGFAMGSDGGRDARFEGTAQLMPSSTAPWVGVTIVQAKHTNGYNRHFGESDFFSTSPSCTIAVELPRIKHLRAQNDLDNYMLFANRRLTAGVNASLLNHVEAESGVQRQSLHFCGIDRRN
jgi:hypothetical protein